MSNANHKIVMHKYIEWLRNQFVGQMIYVVILFFILEYFLIFFSVPGSWIFYEVKNEMELYIPSGQPSLSHHNGADAFENRSKQNLFIAPTNSARRRFWVYLDKTHPALYDAIANENSLFFVFSVRLNMCALCSSISKLSKSHWYLVLQEGQTTKCEVITDPAKQVTIVQCKADMAESGDYFRAGNVTLSLEMPGETPHRYTNVPVSQPSIPMLRSATAEAQAAFESQTTTEPSPAIPVAACTMVRSDLLRHNLSNADRLLEWIAYHHLQVPERESVLDSFPARSTYHHSTPSCRILSITL